jgi:hypothetical protein
VQTSGGPGSPGAPRGPGGPGGPEAVAVGSSAAVHQQAQNQDKNMNGTVAMGVVGMGALFPPSYLIPLGAMDGTCLPLHMACQGWGFQVDT